MSDIQKNLASPVFQLSAKATHAAATVTISKPSATTAANQRTIYITGFILSASAAPTATAEATLTGPTTSDGTTADTLTIELPAAAFAPISRDFGTHPIRIKPNTDAVFTVPDLGVAVIGAITVFYFIGPV